MGSNVYLWKVQPETEMHRMSNCDEIFLQIYLAKKKIALI